jgi:hypothetical protein
VDDDNAEYQGGVVVADLEQAADHMSGIAEHHFGMGLIFTVAVVNLPE